MDCKNCELKNQRQFYCKNCLKSHLREYRLQTQHFATDRDEQVAKATMALQTVEEARLRRANVARWENRVEEVLEGLKKMRKDNDEKRERLQTLRRTLSNRRQTLINARHLPPVPPQSTSFTDATDQISSLSAAIARARSGLVQELVEVFNIVEVGGRPPIGGKAGSKGEWTIGNLILPVPGDIRRYPPAHINAVVTHTLHFLSLLTFYLGIKLPFEVSWNGPGGKMAVGVPWIGAGKGGESGNWANWYTKHPLHLSSSPEPSPSATTSSSSPSTQSSFTTALAMLLYNVTYLAHTQSVEIPLSQAGDVLSNLWAVCCSADLGRRSHETHPVLPAPTPLTFPLDFAQLLQATTASPSRARASFHRSKSIVGGGRKRSTSASRKEKIVEEEEGWDLVDDL